MKETRSLGADHTLTLEAARSAYLDQLRLLGRSEETLAAHANALGQFAKFWGERDLREAALVELEAYAREVKERVSRETAYLYLGSVRALFRFLAESQKILVDPAAGLPMPRMRERLTGRIFTREEMTGLIESPNPSTRVGLRDRALLELLYSTGLRASECRKARACDLGEDAVTVRAGKGGKDRVTPVGKRAMAWVRRYLAEARPAFAVYRPGVEELWISRWGKPFGETVFGQCLRKLGAAAGVDHFTCHMIRRSMATHLLAAGASPLEVSKILGHEDLKSLSRYVRVAAREAKETHGKTHPRETP